MDLERYPVSNPYLWLGTPATAQNTVPGSAGLAASVPGTLCVSAFRLQNASGSAGALALVSLLPDTMWVAGQWDDSETTKYTADTTDAQDAGDNDFALETTTANDGSVLGATVPWGVASIDGGTAGSGTNPVHSLKYWNGSAWTALTAANVFSAPAATDWAAGENLLLFVPPVDWAKGGSGGVSADHYNLLIQRTNATQATAALAKRVYLGEVLFWEDAVAANGTAGLVLTPSYFRVPAHSEGISTAWKTADAANSLFLLYTVKN